MATWKDVPTATLREIATELNGDGWTIYGAEYLINKGIPGDVVRSCIATHRSDGTPKGTISLNGQVVESMVGVYSLTILERICRDLGLEVAGYFGRGSQAQANAEAILAHCIETTQRQEGR